MLLEVKKLTTWFRVGDGKFARAVDGIGFGIAEGETLALVGESGCGKSQTAFSIMQLIESNGSIMPGSEVIFAGRNLVGLPDIEMQKIRGNSIAMIFQEPMSSLNPLYKVASQLSEPLVLHQGMTGRRAREEALALLKHVGIPAPETRLDAYPHELSGGMRQRVMIAMALACRPRLLIADEPTTALDVTIQAQILALMKELQKETGMAILLITHNMGIVSQVADRVCVMYAGRIAETGSRDDIFRDPRHPYTRRLLEAIPGESDLKSKLATIPGRVPSATLFRESGCRFAERCVERIEPCETVTPGMFSCGGNGHSTCCHLLDPALGAGSVPAARAREPRPARSAEGEVLVSAENLCAHFPVRKGLLRRVVNHVMAVDGLNISLRRGETLALVGESGCGKSTAGQSILRLLNEARGRVVFMGKDVLGLSSGQLKPMRRHMQMVFQNPEAALSPGMKMGDIVAEGLEVHEPGLPPDEKDRRIKAALETVRMDPGDIDRYPHEFSGGQKQRIAIARALILEPAFIVLDEPTSALDVSVQAQILNLLEEIQARRNLAYLFITHDLGVVRYISDNVAVMYLGRIVEYAPVAALFAAPRHPYTKMLLDAVPRIGAGRREFTRIVGDVPSPLNPPPGCPFHPRCPLAGDICRVTRPEHESKQGGLVACHKVPAAG